MRIFRTKQYCFYLKKKKLVLIKKYGNTNDYLYRSFFGEIKISDYFLLRHNQNLNALERFKYFKTFTNTISTYALQTSLQNILVTKCKNITGVILYWKYLIENAIISLKFIEFRPTLLITRSKCDYGLILKFFQNIYIGLNMGWYFDLIFLNINYKILLYKSYGQTYLHFFTGQSHAVLLKCDTSVFCITKKRKKLLRLFSYNLFNITSLANKIKILRPVSKYKNKGIRYAGEQLVFKEGKAKQR